MGIFSRAMRSDEHEDLLKKINTLASDLEVLKGAFESLRTNQNSLRGLLNRKVDLSAEEKTEATTEGAIDDGFDELRKLNKDKKP